MSKSSQATKNLAIKISFLYFLYSKKLNRKKFLIIQNKGGVARKMIIFSGKTNFLAHFCLHYKGRKFKLIFRVEGIHFPMGSDAGCGGIEPASSIVIQNRLTSYPLR